MQVELLDFQCVRVIKQMESAMGKRWFANCRIYYQEKTMNAVGIDVSMPLPDPLEK
jgi:hypothetical protein